MFSTPIVLLVFNRPELTRRVLERILPAKPAHLLVVADGPRPHVPTDAQSCLEVRRIVQELVPRECRLATRYSEGNLGCKSRVSSGLHWVFEQVPEAIILEDDCLPAPDFLPFCAEMLDRYREDERIMAVAGTQHFPARFAGGASYGFSRFNYVWGWASWRRAWKHYDVGMKAWPEFRRRGSLRGLLQSPSSRRYWASKFDRVHSGKIDTWDYQWTFAIWSQSGLTVVPAVNLISNQGFGAGATHTTSRSEWAGVPSDHLDFPLTHPDAVVPDSANDLLAERRLFSASWIRRGISRIRPYWNPLFAK